MILNIRLIERFIFPMEQLLLAEIYRYRYRIGLDGT